MKHLALVAVLSLVALGPSPVAAQKGERDVFVTVLDADGTPITGLTPDFFAVREGGKDRTVLRVAPLTTPMHVAVLVDTSAGPAFPNEILRAALGDFLERLSANHNVALYAFGDRAARVTDYTRHAAVLRRAVGGMFSQSEGAAYLIDGVDEALKDLEPINAERPAIVAITTERADVSGKTAASVIKQLIPRATAFHAVTLASATGTGTRGPMGSDRDIPGRSAQLGRVMTLGEGDRERARMLKEGTATTGGGLQRVTSVTALAPALTRLLGELTYSYRLTFSRAGADTPLKDLQVGIMLENVTVRATAAPTGAEK